MVGILWSTEDWILATTKWGIQHVQAILHRLVAHYLHTLTLSVVTQTCFHLSRHVSMGTNSLTRERKGNEEILKPASASILCTGGSLAGTFSRPWLFIDFFLRLLFRICKIDELWLCTAVPDAAAGASILGGGESMTANTRLLHSRTHVPWLWWSSIHMKGLCMCVCVRVLVYPFPFC